MNSTPESIAFERGIQPALQILLPGRAPELAGVRPDPTLDSRIEELARRANEGELTDAEREEYHGYVRANKFVAILQRHARRLLESTP